jgi:hypothetical protein
MQLDTSGRHMQAAWLSRQLAGGCSCVEVSLHVIIPQACMLLLS